MYSDREVCMDTEKDLWNILYSLNQFIYRDPATAAYHQNHIDLTERYAQLLNQKLGNPVDAESLRIIAEGHDLLKEKGLTYENPISWYGHHIPNDLTKYVRMNLDVLDRFDLGDYFNTDVGYHAMAAVIFLVKELHVERPEILYPIAFHSCPILPLYKTLPTDIQTRIDITVLADKLSSNWLRIHQLEFRVKVDLDLLVFGKDRCEFNYTTGLFVARMIGHGSSHEKYGRESMLYYYERAKEQNPFLSKNFSKGDNKIWPKRDENPLLPPSIHN